MTAYLSYLSGDVLGLSGILALFVCAVAISHYALHNISSEPSVPCSCIAASPACLCSCIAAAHCASWGCCRRSRKDQYATPGTRASVHLGVVF